MTTKIHLDTDFGGDIDDLAALALLLNWPDTEITGVTTVAEESGRRAGYARYVLDLAGRIDIPVAAGSDVAGDYFRWRPTYPPESEFWHEPVVPAPGPLDAALALLKRSIDDGAIVVGIGPCTNLALLDQRYPGILRQTQVYLVGGYVFPPRPARSLWGNEVDYNFQMDVAAAQHVPCSVGRFKPASAIDIDLRECPDPGSARIERRVLAVWCVETIARFGICTGLKCVAGVDAPETARPEHRIDVRQVIGWSSEWRWPGIRWIVDHLERSQPDGTQE